jgi:hypothetical protein
MSKPILTKEDIQDILNLDNHGHGDRTGAYILLWQLTGSEEALRQARISSFSGGEGGAAFGAKLQLQRELGAKYPGVFNLSQQVFEASLKNVEKNLPYINAGTMSVDKAMFTGGEAAWTNVTPESLKHDFPGNAFALNPLSSNFLNGLQFSHGTGVAREGANDAVLFGKLPSDFAGLSGFSTHIVKDQAGQLLVTIKDDRTGKTVFVGTGGSGEQAIEDVVGIIARTALHPGADVGKMRQYLKVLRQNEEPGSISIDQHGNITITSEADALKGKTPVERARHHAAQARANAARNPVPAHMKLYDTIVKQNPQIPSVAPIPGRAGQRKAPLLPRAGTGDAAGLSGMSRPQGAAASLTTGSSTGQGAALTGYRKVIADAQAQAVEARARREAGRTAMGLVALGGDLSSRSFAPVGGAGAAGHLASHATPGGAVDQDQLAASPFPSHTAADTLYPRPQPNVNETADSALPGPQHAPGGLPPHALEQALNDYFFRQSRLPPNGGAAFNPYLSPLWAGLKLPG